jgi:hypothetical protein
MCLGVALSPTLNTHARVAQHTLSRACGFICLCVTSRAAAGAIGNFFFCWNATKMRLSTQQWRNLLYQQAYGFHSYSALNRRRLIRCKMQAAQILTLDAA